MNFAAWPTTPFPPNPYLAGRPSTGRRTLVDNGLLAWLAIPRGIAQQSRFYHPRNTGSHGICRSDRRRLSCGSHLILSILIPSFLDFALLAVPVYIPLVLGL